ncbi:PTS sugar transporter subunit IIA [Rhodanobacter lindaniclasticus]
MSVGVLLMTHEAVGQALISAARHVMPQLPLRVAAVEVPPQADPEVMRSLTAHHARELDQGEGVLILADLYGATPCNIGLSLGALGVHLRCVSGCSSWRGRNSSARTSTCRRNCRWAR